MHHAAGSHLYCQQPAALSRSVEGWSATNMGRARQPAAHWFLRSDTYPMSRSKGHIAAPEARARFVVTLPQRPCFLEPALHEVSPEGAPALTATREAYLHLARRARERLVVLSPFVDGPGLEWMIELIAATPAPERILVVRYAHRLAKHPVQTAQLRAMSTDIREYRILHRRSARVKPIETFHAKIIMADAAAAYVGSANLVESSMEIALECGFFIEGPAVSQVVDVVNAILRITGKA
jgi:hypothetical protein